MVRKVSLASEATTAAENHHGRSADDGAGAAKKQRTLAEDKDQLRAYNDLAGKVETRLEAHLMAIDAEVPSDDEEAAMADVFAVPRTFGAADDIHKSFSNYHKSGAKQLELAHPGRVGELLRLDGRPMPRRLRRSRELRGGPLRDTVGSRRCQ